MIQLLASTYRRRIAFLLLLLFDLSFMFSSLANTRPADHFPHYHNRTSPMAPGTYKLKRDPEQLTAGSVETGSKSRSAIPKQKYIGGPSQPEMSSFKSVGTDNMVNLFTGDFSYNIPLLDVGGYPVNIYYNGGIGLEQEASWVGLGWNINPGNINRNMRGVPDDFNGEEKLIQTQNMKPNKTWGASVGADLEGIGIKTSSIGLTLGASMGISFNNYLGPALDMGFKGGVSFKVADKAKGEKDGSIPPGLRLGVSADLNSRSGLTLSPSVSLSASSFISDRTISAGIGLSTSYNSRSGIKELQISEQMSANRYDEECKVDLEKQEISKKTQSSTIGASLFSTAISFAKPSYIPSIRLPLNNEAYSGHFQLGGAIFGVYGSVEAEVYKQTSAVSKDKIIQRKPLIGYLYAEKALSDANAVMDFARFNDREVTPHTPIISAPQYSYDVFSIQGEGTGGSIRAYRNDLGYVRDNATGSQDKNAGVGIDIGIPGHYGVNVNLITTPTTIGEWSDGNKLHTTIPFQGPHTGSWENVYFRNPGESGVLNSGQYTGLGGTDLVRFELSGEAHNPVVKPVLDRFSKSGTFIGSVTAALTNPSIRKKRTQVIDFLTAADAAVVGLDKKIKSYDNQTILNSSTHALLYTEIDRSSDDGYRKANHISQINVTESNGKRYIYGIPVYNKLQRDFTFTVINTDLNTPASADKVGYTDQEANPLTNPAINGGTGSRDGYAQVTETPPYAHSFLLSGLLSPDYVDVTGNGITEDDLGDAVKFNYTQIKQSNGDPAVYRWRTPMGDHLANFNAGKKSDLKDDKGIISYGERESWYLHSIESKTMIALFTLEDRADGNGVNDEKGAVNSSDNALKRLKEINLYSKADLKKNGLANAKPIKTVHFKYSYRLCQSTPDNPVGSTTPDDPLGKGKLSLDGIYFTYNGQNRLNKNQYIFSYAGSDGSGNPDYSFNASDRWGTYKPASMNPAGLKNSDYPYTPQSQAGQDPKSTLDQNAGAWSLKRILLPSGGQIEVQYESDDYAFVQNRRATEMMSIAGFGNTPTAITNRLYDLPSGAIVENDYLFVNVPQSCANNTEVYQKYLQGMDQIAVKLAVNMPQGTEYLTSYANIEDYGKYDDSKIWIKLKRVNGLSPLSITAIEYLREQLPGQAYGTYDLSESADLQGIGSALIEMLSDLGNAFRDPASVLRSQGKAQIVRVDQSFARLNNPFGYKYGGGHRVKSVILKDNWQAMTQQFNSVYGQTYDYTTTEVFNGAQRTISSGVASYEPSIGGDENPFQTIVQVADKLPLGPVSYGAVEMPVLDAFFPAPLVGYSKVTVKSLPSVQPPSGQKSRSGIGRQVTEFYTAKDYPVYYSNTSFDPATDKQAHDASTTAFFYKYTFDSRALSQGFLIETNDMHGKLKSQSSYAENDPTVRVNYTENFYRNTGVNGLDDQFDFVSAAQSGVVGAGNMGIDIELMTDTREFAIKSTSLEIEGQLDLFPVVLPFWLPFIWPVTGNSENNYRAVTTTKVINYHSVLDSVVVFDKGSQVSTKNLVFDSETGAVIVSRTNNEFDQPIYNINYPAWWAYSGMGLAYLNTGVTYTGVNFFDGRIQSNPNIDASVFESGDELYVTDQGTAPTDACGAALASGNVARLWVFDTNKSTTSLTVPSASRSFIIMDSLGTPYTKNAVSFRIIRSGKRNQLDLNVSSAAVMNDPVQTINNTKRLVLNNADNVISASAVAYKEKWGLDCIDYTVHNPYRDGLLGDFKPYRNYVYYGQRNETDPTAATSINKNGYINGFNSYWSFNAQNNLVPDNSNPAWVWTNELLKVNARSQEVATVDALNRFTSAQYGYNKCLPTAIVQNASDNEMFYEGFEDYGYEGTLNSSALCQESPKITLSGTGISHSVVIPGQGHTGNYMLQVNQNQSQTVDLFRYATTPYNSDNIQFNFPTGSISNTTTTGGAGGVNGTASLTDNLGIVHTGLLSTSVYSAGINIQNSCGGAGCSGNTFNGNTSLTGYYIPTQTTGLIMYLQGDQTISGSCSGLPTLLVTGAGVTVYDNDGNVVGSGGSGGGSPDVNGRIAITIPNPTSYQIGKVYKIVANVSFSGSIPNCGPSSGSSLNITNYIALQGTVTPIPCYKNVNTNTTTVCESYTKPLDLNAPYILTPRFGMVPGKQMLFSAWVKPNCGANNIGESYVQISTDDNSFTPITLKPSGNVIEGWQKIEGTFTIPANFSYYKINLTLANGSTCGPLYFDDIRIHPFNANMKSYVYDPVNLRLIAEMDANNYATFYEYDEEGTLIRTKAETREGVKTIKETRSAKQKNITAIQ